MAPWISKAVPFSAFMFMARLRHRADPVHPTVAVNQLVAPSFGAGGMMFDAQAAREFATRGAGRLQTEWLHIRRNNFRVDTLLSNEYSSDVSVQMPLIQVIVPRVVTLRPILTIPRRFAVTVAYCCSGRSEDDKRKNKDLQDLAAREFATLRPPQSEGLHKQLGSLGPQQSEGLHKQLGRSVDRTI
ncbi:hypothetical protein Cgig2_016806 [Carnegiea gigantea]|uniref:Uncharacterized protein n=1 Tax=Carnegiea gigantea TaxID=171969 RepID=A0A9Q1JJT2_9CARY|nr:hypothetical protein Cgig2_016806 [Carnegiea gigantea]